MAHRIEVGLLPEYRDALGEKLRKRAEEQLGIEGIEQIRIVDVYTVDAGLTPEQLQLAAGYPLRDEVIQHSSTDEPLPGEFDWAIEVGFRPGVTDNVGRTAAEAIALATGRPFAPGEAVYTSRQVRLTGRLDRRQVERIAWELVANRLIQQVRILDGAEFQRQGGFSVVVPKLEGLGRPAVESIELPDDDDLLAAISRSRVLALSVREMRAIRSYYTRPDVAKLRGQFGLPAMPTDVELEAIAQTWSEHCKHKIFNARIRYTEQGKTEEIDSLFKTYIRGATERVRRDKGERDLCLSVFEDNAGVIRFDEDWSLVFKVETHNSPSALDPYGGALTGIVGVNRDP
ncbi:MAG: phosphoribosylformylglycinamidine synthase, partial [Deltaproteobacteria bacterium]